MKCDLPVTQTAFGCGFAELARLSRTSIADEMREEHRRVLRRGRALASCFSRPARFEDESASPPVEDRCGNSIPLVEATARKRTLDAVMLAHANAPCELAADRCDFAYFDSAALCA